jgi:hypothetical protein
VKNVLNVMIIILVLVNVKYVKLIEYLVLNQIVHVPLVISQIQLVNHVITDVLNVLSMILIVIHVPLTESTNHLVSVHQVIGMMKLIPNVHLVVIHVLLVQVLKFV